MAITSQFGATTGTKKKHSRIPEIEAQLNSGVLTRMVQQRESAKRWGAEMDLKERQFAEEKSQSKKMQDLEKEARRKEMGVAIGTGAAGFVTSGMSNKLSTAINKWTGSKQPMGPDVTTGYNAVGGTSTGTPGYSYKAPEGGTIYSQQNYPQESRFLGQSSPAVKSAPVSKGFFGDMNVGGGLSGGLTGALGGVALGQMFGGKKANKWSLLGGILGGLGGAGLGAFSNFFGGEKV